MLPFLILIPILIAAAFFVISSKICWKEFLIILCSVLAVNLLGVALAYAGAVHDTELLNGKVTGKNSVKVSCSHSYQCNCYTTTTCSGSGPSRTCSNTQHCQTCYEHPFDVDWRVITSVGDLTISRVDRQGLVTPARWSEVIIGEPASLPHHFVNYIKAAPGSVLRMSYQKTFDGLMPNYPSVYDYYRANHLLTVGVNIPHYSARLAQLNDINARLGNLKQVNIIFVIVNTADRNYQYALQQHWLGGKKNDLIVIIGSADREIIDWAAVVSWSEVELLKVQIKDFIMEVGTLEYLDEILTETETLIEKEFHRKPMADFAYLRYQFSPSPTMIVFLLFVGVSLSLGLGLYFVNNDPFRSGLNRNWRYRR